MYGPSNSKRGSAPAPPGRVSATRTVESRYTSRLAVRFGLICYQCECGRPRKHVELLVDLGVSLTRGYLTYFR